MSVGIEDGLRWVVDSQLHGSSLTISVVTGTTVIGEVGRLVDDRSGPRIGACVGGIPEGTAEVDRPELAGI